MTVKTEQETLESIILTGGCESIDCAKCFYCSNCKDDHTQCKLSRIFEDDYNILPDSQGTSYKFTELSLNAVKSELSNLVFS